MARVKAGLIALLMTSCLLPFSSSAVELLDPANQNEPYEEVGERIEHAFEGALAEYDRAVELHPSNVRLALRRCDVIQSFIYLDEFVNETAAALAETCLDDVNAAYASHPEVALARIDRLYGEEAIALGNRTHESEMDVFNRAQHSRLHVALAKNYRWIDDIRLAEYQCMRAMALDLGADCRLDAAGYHWRTGKKDLAVELLRSTLDPHNEPYYLVQKIEKLAEFDANDELLDVFNRLPEDSLNDHLYVQLATYLAGAGHQAPAERMLASVSDDHWDPRSAAQAGIDIGVRFGDFDKALTYYNTLRDSGFSADPLLRIRLGLALKDPGLPWRLRDLFGVLAILATVTILIAFSALFPALVHYRGLVRSTREQLPGLSNPQWNLKHAWYVSFSLIFGGLVAVYLYEYAYLLYVFDETAALIEPENLDLGRQMIVSTGILVLMALPLIARKERWRQFGVGNWSLPKCIGIALGVAVAARLVFVAAGALLLNENSIANSFANTSATHEAMLQVQREFGTIALALLVVGLVPLIEETVFRGVLLHGFARHISFGGANLLQSILFASLHEDWLFFPLFVGFAYAAGLISRRSGGLLTAIMMHAVFNATALLVILA